ncbi:MAG: NAD(P)H-hydrate dehydratase [Ferrimicrobium sp.]
MASGVSREGRMVMRPVVTVADVRRVDAQLAKQHRVDSVIQRVGEAAAAGVVRSLGGSYGRRILVVLGPGNNGRDGLATAEALRRRGVRVDQCSFLTVPPVERLHHFDAVVDAAFGTGLQRGYSPLPFPANLPVFSIDVPSGLDADLGVAVADGEVVQATHTFAIGAVKPGHLLGIGRERTGLLHCILDGLFSGAISIHLAEEVDLDRLLPSISIDRHKWSSGVFVIGGSPGMRGAPLFVSSGAMAVGAGIVHLFTRTDGDDSLSLGLRPEVVVQGLDSYVVEPIAQSLSRFRAGVIGPGLGQSLPVATFVRRLLIDTEVPIVLDADGLTAVGDGGRIAKVLRERQAPTILTPHEGEFITVFGAIGGDRIASVRRAAALVKSVVLLKGNPTIVANHDGQVVISAAGNPKLASAGNGDVLSGVIAGCIAIGMDPFTAAWVGAELHGRAGSRAMGPTVGVEELVRAIALEVASHEAPAPVNPGATVVA